MMKLLVKGECVYRRLLQDRKAVTSLEYALVGAVLTGVVVLGFSSLGIALSNKFTEIGTSL